MVQRFISAGGPSVPLRWLVQAVDNRIKFSLETAIFCVCLKFWFDALCHGLKVSTRRAMKSLTPNCGSSMTTVRACSRVSRLRCMCRVRFHRGCPNARIWVWPLHVLAECASIRVPSIFDKPDSFCPRDCTEKRCLLQFGNSNMTSALRLRLHTGCPAHAAAVE